MSRRVIWLGWFLISGCGAAGGSRQAPAPAPVAAEAPPPAPAPPAPPDDGCPKEALGLELEQPRKIDTRRAATIPYAEYKRMKWFAGHWKPPGKAFSRAAKDAVDQVVEVEARNPRLIPAPFRDELLANPRDAALRLRVARCEQKHAATSRRAAHDAAMALLLGAPAEETDKLIGEAAEGKRSTKSFCSAQDPKCDDEGSYCDAEREECVTRDEHVHSYISDDELTIEDALTRALFRAEIAGEARTLSEDTRGAWMQYTVHRCGKLLCRLSDYEVNGDVKLVVYDRRDGGSVQEVPLSKAERARRARCSEVTGFPTAGACRNDCFDRYGIHGRVGWEAQDRCKAACDRLCP